ncbi:MAG: DUF2797 domain-containing protein [Bacteroidota bacterium]
MQYSGNLRKMKGKVEDGRVGYSLELGDDEIQMDELLDRSLDLQYQGKINCIRCEKETRKSYGQGFCYQCFTTAPEADECVLKPDRCKAHLGISRDMEWSRSHCLQPHIVYLAVSGGLKVGVTRESQVPVRWIDQGAAGAVPLCRTPNRHVAGVIETFLMSRFGDKTNWKKMLTNEDMSGIDLLEEKDKALAHLPAELRRYALYEIDMFSLQYPVLTWPAFPAQVNLDRDRGVKGVLKGIRGQYLIFDNQKVLNIRRFSGYLVTVFY